MHLSYQHKASFIPPKLQNFVYPSKHSPSGLYIVAKYCSTKSSGVEGVTSVSGSSTFCPNHIVVFFIEQIIFELNRGKKRYEWLYVIHCLY